MELTPIENRTGKQSVYGISEWSNWYGHYDLVAEDPDTVVDECIDVHVELGFTDLVWDAGRSTLDYHSKLPGTTRAHLPERGSTDHNRQTARDVLARMCPLRYALERCRRDGIGFLARLAMNRHYGGAGAKYRANTSEFAESHPEYHERQTNGKSVSHKLCYAIEAVRQERIEILLELQRIGPDALLLDFCRQSPILMYHPAVVDPFVGKTGNDPSQIGTGIVEDYLEWWQFRADILTGFMRELRERVRQQEDSLGRACPIVARVPDASREILLGLGSDLVRWFEEGLIDATMVSPFPLVREDAARHFDWHIDLAHRQGKACIGGLGSMGLFQHHNMGRPHPFQYEPKPAYEIVQQQYEAGCDGMSVYQTETLARLDYLAELQRDVGYPETIAWKGSDLPGDPRVDLTPIGLDWHSCVCVRPQHGLTDEVESWLRI